MTIQKKSLISTLNTTKKAIVASKPAEPASTSEARSSARQTTSRNTRTLTRTVARTPTRAV